MGGCDLIQNPRKSIDDWIGPYGTEQRRDWCGAMRCSILMSSAEGWRQ